MKIFLSKSQKTIKLFLPLIIILFVTTAFSSEPEWYLKFKEVKILRTTKQDIEKLFNYPQITYISQKGVSLWVEYKIREGEITSFYSLGRCSEVKEPKYSYNVDKNVLTDIEINLEKPVDISKLGLDLRGFYKSEISDVAGVFEYRNETIGERYIIGEYFKNNTKKISDIYFSPSESDEKMACKEIFKRN